MSLTTTRHRRRSRTKKMRQRPTRRRHSSSRPCTSCTSPVKGCAHISVRVWRTVTDATPARSAIFGIRDLQLGWRRPEPEPCHAQYVVDVLRAMAVILTIRLTGSSANRMRQWPTRRRHSSAVPRRRCTSPPRGCSYISSIAASSRRRSCAGTRLSDRRALAARSTRQLTLHHFPGNEVPALEVPSARAHGPFFVRGDWFVLERDVLGANRDGRRRTVGYGGAPRTRSRALGCRGTSSRHLGNSGGEGQAAFYHRHRKAFASPCKRPRSLDADRMARNARQPWIN